MTTFRSFESRPWIQGYSPWFWSSRRNHRGLPWRNEGSHRRFGGLPVAMDSNLGDKEAQARTCRLTLEPWRLNQHRGSPLEKWKLTLEMRWPSWIPGGSPWRHGGLPRTYSASIWRYGGSIPLELVKAQGRLSAETSGLCMYVCLFHWRNQNCLYVFHFH